MMSVQEFFQSRANQESGPEKKGFFSRLVSGFFFLMVMLMGLGNWADTKQLFSEAYQAFITHLTHQIEEKRVSSLDIGNYLQFAQKSVGMPEVIKTSNIDQSIEYRYYKDPKYLLTLINRNQRILGITLHSLEHKKPLLSEFTPPIPFSNQKLIVSSINNITSGSNLFFYDNQNITYYLQSKQLGPEGMYLHLLAGFTEYQKINTNSNRLLAELNNATIEGNSYNINLLTKKLSSYSANFYAISELPPEYIADSLLTKYEFNTYF